MLSKRGSPADVQAVLDRSKRETSTLLLSIEKFKSIVTSVDANKLRVILKFFSHQYISSNPIKGTYLPKGLVGPGAMNNTTVSHFLTLLLRELVTSKGHVDKIQVLLDDGRANAFRNNLELLEICEPEFRDVLMEYYMKHEKLFKKSILYTALKKTKGNTL